MRPRSPGFRRTGSVAAVRSFGRGPAGWTWSPRIADLGPPAALFRRYLAARRRGTWPAEWPAYAAAFRAWTAAPPCAALLDCLARRAKAGQVIALACWWCAAIG